MRDLLPSGTQCHDQGESPNAVRCTVGGIDVDYRLLGRSTLRSAFGAAVGGASSPSGPGHAPPACARGGEDERSWSRPEAPSRAVGRYACRVEQGRAAMWWTVDDRGLLVHAIAGDGDLATLFAWWESHSER